MGGLYRLTYSEEGEVTGSSERGNRFEGTVKGSNLSATVSTSEEAPFPPPDHVVPVATAELYEQVGSWE